LGRRGSLNDVAEDASQMAIASLRLGCGTRI
jgi:hypothetical protein